jgi:hypothetical protein
MIKFNQQQQINIKNLNPLTDSKFIYNTSKWEKLNNDLKEKIKEFENKEITRNDVTNSYKEYFNGNSKDFIKPFLITMVWGFANAGYGTHRTNKYLTTPGNDLLIKNALDQIKISNQESLKNAFKSLKKIDGLGVSYITKVLHFATYAQGYNNYALIFDIRVAVALLKLTTPKEIFDIISVSPSSKFKDYQNYIKLIHKIAKENNVNPDQLEMYLFNQEFE